jgi:hypothetical protein
MKVASITEMATSHGFETGTAGGGAAEESLIDRILASAARCIFQPVSIPMNAARIR